MSASQPKKNSFMSRNTCNEEYTKFPDINKNMAILDQILFTKEGQELLGVEKDDSGKVISTNEDIKYTYNLFNCVQEFLANKGNDTSCITAFDDFAKNIPKEKQVIFLNNKIYSIKKVIQERNGTRALSSTNCFQISCVYDALDTSLKTLLIPIGAKRLPLIASGKIDNFFKERYSFNGYEFFYSDDENLKKPELDKAPMPKT